MNRYFGLVCVAFIFLVGSLAAQSDKNEEMKEWSYKYEVNYVQIDSQLSMAYVDEGEGATTLLFVHGLGSNLQAWNKNISQLKDRFRCIAVDLPGYGKSSQGDYAFTPTFFANQLDSFCKKLNLEELILVGHSMGGQVATCVALNNPSYLKKMVLVAPAGFEKFTDEEHVFFNTFVTPEIIRNSSPQQIRKNFELNFFELKEDAEFMIEDRMAMIGTPYYDHFVQMIPKCVHGMLSEPIFNRLNELEIPVLVIYGLNDALIPNTYLHQGITTQSVAEEGVAQIPFGKLLLLDEAGHFVQWDQSLKLNEAIFDFANAKEENTKEEK